jgi:hypothetical protein
MGLQLMAKRVINFTKKILPKILLLLVAFLVLYTWFSVVNIDEIIENFKKFKPLPTIGTAFSLLFVHFLNSLCLKLLIDPVKKVNMTKIFQIYLTGAFLNTVGGIQHIGFAVEIFLFYKLLEIPVSVSISAFGIMRLIGLGVTFLPLIFLPLVDFKIHNFIKFGISFSAVLFVFLIIFIFLLLRLEERGLKILQRLLFLFPEKFTIKFLNFISSIFNSIKTMGKSKINILFVALVLLILPIVNLAGGGFAFFSFPFETKKIVEELNKSPWQIVLSVIIGQSILSILFSLPSMPAQIGTMEWYIWLVFVHGFGFPENIISAMTLLMHPLFFLTTVIAGGITTFLLGIKLSLLKEELINFSKNYGVTNGKN